MKNARRVVLFGVKCQTLHQHVYPESASSVITVVIIRWYPAIHSSLVQVPWGEILMMASNISRL